MRKTSCPVRFLFSGARSSEERMVKTGERTKTHPLPGQCPCFVPKREKSAAGAAEEKWGKAGKIKG